MIDGRNLHDVYILLPILPGTKNDINVKYRGKKIKVKIKELQQPVFPCGPPP